MCNRINDSGEIGNGKRGRELGCGSLNLLK